MLNQSIDNTNNFIFSFSDVDDEGIERDSDDVEDYKSRHTKDLDHILDVSKWFLSRILLIITLWVMSTLNVS